MNIFANISRPIVQKSVFNLSHEKKLSCNMGAMVPVLFMDCLPTDYISGHSEIFIRFAPLLAPILHRVNVSVHYFSVPMRILMQPTKFEEFITGYTKNGKESKETLPVINFSEINGAPRFQDGTLMDYLGLPTTSVDLMQLSKADDKYDQPISILPFLAYAHIWNEYYRDQDLHEAIDTDYWTWDFSDSIGLSKKLLAITNLRFKAWEKDYFTSARPWAQKGDPVPIPGQMGGSGKVLLNKNLVDNQRFNPVDGSPIIGGPFDVEILESGGTVGKGQLATSFAPSRGGGTVGLGFDPNGSLYVDSPSATALPLGYATVNDLRVAVQIQRYLERAARGGTRYIEWLYNFFGSVSSDARLQRPEYIGGGTQPVVISEVLQTSQTTTSGDDASPLGTLGGHAISAGHRNSFHHKFEEHSYLIGIMHIIPRTSYQEGIPRHWFKTDKFEFGLPMFAHLGEQAVYNKELIVLRKTEAVGSLSTWNDGTFGYQPRYSEYRYLPSTVHGDFRNSLLFWHMGIKFRTKDDELRNTVFSNVPVLNSKFVTSNPTYRIFAVENRLTVGDDQRTALHHLWCLIRNHVRAVRPLPRFSDPGFMDHF